MKNVDKIKVGSQLRLVLLLLSSVLLLLGSIFVWIYVSKSVENQRKTEFLNVVEKTEERVQDMTTAVVERLYDLRGFVNSMEIDSKMWQKYLVSVGVEERYPSVYTFAYAPRVERKNIKSFLSEVRSVENDIRYDKYSVFPETDSTEVYPIKYLFTSDTDLGSLLGYDLGTSETQVAAIKNAVFEDKPVITDLLHLDLVISGSSKIGYEVMLPVYSKIGIENYSKEERKQYFMGLVGTWVFPEWLVSDYYIKGVLVSKEVSLSVFDGEHNIFSIGDGSGDFKETKEINILDKSFRFEFVGKRKMILSPFAERLPLMTLISLVVINLMWGATVTVILLSRREAERMAIEATKDLWKFKQAVEGVSDMVIITDKDGVILYVNKASERITGYRRESMLDKKASLWGKQMSEAFYKRFWKTIREEKKPFWGVITNKRKSGELYEAELNVSPILDDKGELLFFVGIERDLSKVRAIEKMKTEFIALASHQLRTPLSAVKWFGKMLLSDEAGKLSTMQRDYIEKINESNEREIRLVNSLLSVSRIESGKIVIKPRPTDIHEMTSAVVTDFKMEVEKMGRKLTVVVDKKIPIINIDEDLIRHVYANLISNAIRYTNKGGRIILKVFLSKNSVMTEVKDNGIGIPKDEQKRVFEKFFRGSNALKKETDGSGLGLFLAKTIVDSSGGKMGFRSSEKKGSTFWFSLPIKTKEKSR